MPTSFSMAHVPVAMPILSRIADFLILLDGVVDDARTDAIRHRLYEIEWDCGEVLSAIVRSRQACYSGLGMTDMRCAAIIADASQVR